MNNKWFLQISLTTGCLAFFITVLGAYVRLSNAGLDCTDRSGCFGQIGAQDKTHEIMQTVNLYPHLNVHSLPLINFSLNTSSAITSPNDTNKVLS